MGPILAAAALTPGRLFACAACFGQSDSAMAAGMNWGILSLLGMIVVVLGGVAAFFIFLARRAAMVPQLVPTSITSDPDPISTTGSDQLAGFSPNVLPSRTHLKYPSAAAQPRHLCAPVQTPGRSTAQRKRA